MIPRMQDGIGSPILGCLHGIDRPGGLSGTQDAHRAFFRIFGESATGTDGRSKREILRINDTLRADNITVDIHIAFSFIDCDYRIFVNLTRFISFRDFSGHVRRCPTNCLKRMIDERHRNFAVGGNLYLGDIAILIGIGDAA